MTMITGTTPGINTVTGITMVTAMGRLISIALLLLA
jgi:hypothetical protein